LDKEFIQMVAQKEREIIIKNITLSGSFVLFWSPYLFKIFYEVTLKNPVPIPVDAICVLLALLNSALNPCIVYVCDTRIRRNLNAFLGIKDTVGSGSSTFVTHQIGTMMGTTEETSTFPVQ
jgi:hypothetical protein